MKQSTKPHKSDLLKLRFNSKEIDLSYVKSFGGGTWRWEIENSCCESKCNTTVLVVLIMIIIIEAVLAVADYIRSNN